MQASEPELPAGWLRKETRAGKVYYFCGASGQTQFEHPGGLEAEQPPTPPATPTPTAAVVTSEAPTRPEQQPATPVAQPRGTAAGSDLLPGWEVQTTRAGKKFYFNSTTNETRFDLPETSEEAGAPDLDGKTPEPKPAPAEGVPPQPSPESEPEPVMEHEAVSMHAGGAAELPPGWREKQQRSGKIYYFHTPTGQTQLDKPA